MGDETTKIFLNAKGSEGKICPELKAFLKFISSSTEQVAEESNSEYIKSLYKKIEFVKHNDDLGEKFMTFEEKLQEVAYQERSAGIKQGKKEEQLSIAKRMKDKGLELEIIVETTGLTFEEIENL